MLVFVIPFKSRESCSSWLKAGMLLRRCLTSVCHQTHAAFRVIVVCHELPEDPLKHPRLEYVQVDFPLPLHEQGRSAAETRLIIGQTDKGRKILRGLVEAGQYHPTHTMVVDADDCISRRLAEFVAQHPHSPGWFVNRGYRYGEGGDRLYLKRWKFNEMCGSCNILRYDLSGIPVAPAYNRGYGYYSFQIDHEKVRGWLEKDGTPLKPLPFAGAVYVVGTGENLFYDERRFPKTWLTRLNHRRLSPQLRREFGLYPLRAGRVVDPCPAL